MGPRLFSWWWRYSILLAPTMEIIEGGRAGERGHAGAGARRPTVTSDDGVVGQGGSRGCARRGGGAMCDAFRRRVTTSGCGV